MAENRLLAGIARTDITPGAGVHLSGSVGTFRPARLAWDPLHARALVLESAGKRLCIVALDVTIITEQHTARIRDEASSRFGLEPDAVMVHATQTHSAPSIGTIMVDPDFPPLPAEFEWVGGAESQYSEWATGRAIEAIAEAIASLSPVSMGVGSGVEGRAAFNRRAVMRNGQVGMPGRTWREPLGPTDILYIEGPMDPELGVICLRSDDLSMKAVLANYACHPVHVFPRPIISADWPGALSEALARGQHCDCEGMVLNGACGNLNPWPPFDPDYVEDHRTMAGMLANVAAKVIEEMDYIPQAELDWTASRIPLPLRKLTDEELGHSRGIIEQSPQPAWLDETKTAVDPEWMVAASVYSVHLMRQRSPFLDYEIQALRIGDTVIVGLPGEPFVEAQLQIKLASPAVRTYIAHCTSQYVGYIPTADALTGGGHEVNTRYWAKLAPESFGLVVDGANAAVTRLFEG